MAGGNVPNNEGRVTTRELYNALKEQNKERRDMESRIMAKIDCLPAVKNQVDTNTKEIDHLRKRSNYWDAGNTVGLIVAGVLSAIGWNK